MHLLILLPALLLPLTAAQAPPSPPSPSAVLLSSIKTLTLRSNSLTTSRRSPPIPQLTCVGGSACALHTVDVMRCTNAGSEYGKEDVQWTCRAELPEEFRLGSTEVVCEGFEGPEDEWVLKGSCGVEYRLVLTERGRERFGDVGEKGGFGGGERGGGEKGLGERAFEVVFWAIFLGIVALILRSIFTNNGNGAANTHPRRRQNPNYGGYDDNNDDGHDEPPPPYTPHAKPSPRSSTSSNPSSWRPGFFTGAATGAAAGYAMGSRTNRAAPQQGQAGPSNWFGGSSGQSASRSSFASGGRGAGSSSPPGGLSGATYESRGFGGSRRR